MTTSIARSIEVPTRLGVIPLTAYPIFGSPLEISAEKRSLTRRRKKPLHIPNGAVFIPRRYGPKKRLVVMQVYEDVFDALRSRYGVSAYYGRPGRGALFRAQTIVTRLRAEADTAGNADKAAFLNRLALKFEEGVYAKGRLLSRVEVWHNALLLVLADDLRVLRNIRVATDVFRQGGTLDPKAFRDQIACLRLAPFVDIQSRIGDLVGQGTDPVTFQGRFHGEAADELIDRIDGYLLRAKFEELHGKAKEIERGMADDFRRRLNTENAHLHVQSIDGLLAQLRSIADRIPQTYQRFVINRIVNPFSVVSRTLDDRILCREALVMFSAARSNMKKLSAGLA